MKIIKKFKNWNPSNYAIILLLLLPMISFVFKSFRLDNDFWFLINTGKEILKNGFIKIEPFTIHQGLSFIPQQWLTDIIFYLIYNKFSIFGMFIFVLIINEIIVFLIYKLSMLICNKKNVSLILSIISDITLLIFDIITTRPQIFDIVLFLMELYLIEKYVKEKNKKCLYILPIISLLLINLHASMWFMFFVLLLPYYVEWFILKLKKQEIFKLKPIIIVTIISIIFGFINPYGLDSILYLFGSYGVKEINETVGEMKPIVITNSLIIYILIFIVLCFIYKNKGKNKIRYILLFLGTTYLLLSHYKGLLFWIIISIFIISDTFTNKVNLKNYKLSIFEKVIYGILTIILLLVVIFNVNLINDHKLKYIADYLDKNANHDIKLFTGYNNGAYMEYRGYECYIDPRAEVFLKKNNKKEDIFKEYYKLGALDLESELFIKKYDFDYILVDETDLFFDYILKGNHDYEKVLEVEDDYYNIVYKLYKKNNNE